MTASNTLSLGTFLYKNLRLALAWSKSQREVADLASASYSTATVDEWHKIRNEFDLDQSKPNPYEEVDNRSCSFSFDRHSLLISSQMLLWPS